MNNKAIQEVGYDFNVSKLSEALIPVLSVCKFFEETDQISFRYRPALEGGSTIDKFKDGIGSLYNAGASQWLGQETDFTCCHPEIQNTYLEEIVNTIANGLGFKTGRYRLMRLKPKSCYTWHRDPTSFRLHIPVLTNDSCFYLTERGGLEKMPVVGRLYKVKTSEHHTAINASLVDRLHLIISIVD